MNSSLTTLERFASSLNVSPILAQRGFCCTLLTLEPDTETALPGRPAADDQLLFVIDGDIAVHTDGLTTIVNRGGAYLLPSGRSPVISARSGAPTRVLRVEIPPRQFITPQIITPRA